jgi:hypothetical protein
LHQCCETDDIETLMALIRAPVVEEDAPGEDAEGEDDGDANDGDDGEEDDDSEDEEDFDPDAEGGSGDEGSDVSKRRRGEKGGCRRQGQRGTHTFTRGVTFRLDQLRKGID